MIDPSIMNDLPDMIQLAIMACDKPPKAVAMDLKCSTSVVYQSLKGKKNSAVQCYAEVFRNQSYSGGFYGDAGNRTKKLFRYRKSDRHIQARLLELRMYDKKADEAMNRLSELLFNKNSYEDLSESDKEILLSSIDAMIERDNISLNLFMELDTRFNLDLVNTIKKARFSNLKRA